MSPTGADLSKLDADAVRATQRLISRGFEAYLVGGCVRDLLLGRSPKDYDIATEARPPQVKRTFPRNSRIIGRRFKLAHLHFNNNTKILEVSTFRRTPQDNVGNGAPEEADLLITRDNEFGTAEEDALRRDFTVNALFLDPTRDLILDYTNGLADVRDRVIRTIGDPRVRFREDPVRILRAAKFAGRLGFSIEPETFAAMAETSGDLVRSAPPRLLEEIQRLLRGGHALDSFQLLRDVGALKSLVPVLAEFLATARHDQRVGFWRLLEALDHKVLGTQRVPQNAVLLGALLVCPVLAKADANPGRSPSSIAEELLGPLCMSLRLPRRDAGCLKRICGVQHRFLQNDDTKRFRIAGFVHGPYFEEALELFELRMLALGDGADAVQRWNDLAAGMGHHAAADSIYQDRDDDEDPAARGEVEPTAEAAAAPSVDERGEEPPFDATEPTADQPAAVDGEPAAAGDLDQRLAGEPGDGSGRRRRRRRRRGRGRRDEFRSDHQAGPSPEDAGADQPAESVPTVGDTTLAVPIVDALVHDQAPARPRRAVRADFIHPEGAEDGDLPAPAETGAGQDRASAPESRGADDASAGEPGRRRRRRRRRRGRGRDAEGRFPPSGEPAPHGEATDLESDQHEPLGEADSLQDPDAPQPAPSSDEPDGEDREPGAGDEDGGTGEASADEGPEEGAPDVGGPGGDGERRGRRRRRRNRRGRNRDGQPGGGAPGQPPQAQRQPQQQRPQQQQGQGQQSNQGQQRPDRPQEPRRQDRQEGRERRRGNRQGDRGQGDRGQGDRGQGDRGRGSPRDVDVVPRYRDRRGKVDVIEPPPLDLSAFDVELDPKRVPTFGSIVEGKGRPKKRTPRVPEDGIDDYKPPPPPGSGPGPSAPPPPPPADTPDTFGDW